MDAVTLNGTNLVVYTCILKLHDFDKNERNGVVYYIQFQHFSGAYVSSNACI